MSQPISTAEQAGDIRQAQLWHENAILPNGHISFLMAPGVFLASRTGVLVRNHGGVRSSADPLRVAGVYGGLAAVCAVLGVVWVLVQSPKVVMVFFGKVG